MVCKLTPRGQQQQHVNNTASCFKAAHSVSNSARKLRSPSIAAKPTNHYTITAVQVTAPTMSWNVQKLQLVKLQLWVPQNLADILAGISTRQTGYLKMLEEHSPSHFSAFKPLNMGVRAKRAPEFSMFVSLPTGLVCVLKATLPARCSPKLSARKNTDFPKCRIWTFQTNRYMAHKTKTRLFWQLRNDAVAIIWYGHLRNKYHYQQLPRKRIHNNNKRKETWPSESPRSVHFWLDETPQVTWIISTCPIATA